MAIKNFDDFIREKEAPVNEFLGLGDLFKSFIGSFSEPIKKKVELLTKNIESKTGKIKDAESYKQTIMDSFDSIVQDKKADLNSAESSDDVKEALKGFFSEVKGIFVAAKLPIMGILTTPAPEPAKSSDNAAGASATSESLITEAAVMSKPETKDAFIRMMNSSDGKKFDTNFALFFKAWGKEFGDDFKKLKTESATVIDNLMKTLKTKLKDCSIERLKGLASLQAKKGAEAPSAEEIKNVKGENSDDVSDDPKANLEIALKSKSNLTPKVLKLLATPVDKMNKDQKALFDTLIEELK